uniref:Uncharacterized protein n=1 Tax=Rangifer tarandus platyrhynchus TaxID=3082113 RepID=A0ACB0F3W3_RANTA|nr:unnamed protein product [Rangifer tarandus platyrhynchus]
MGFFCLVSVSCKVPPGKPQPQPLDGTAAFTHRFSGNHYSRHPDHPHGKIPGQEDPRRAHIELGLPEKNGASENRLKSMETRGEPHLWGVRRETRDKALLPPRTQSHQPPGEQTSLLGTLGPQEPHRGWRSWGGAVTAKLLPHHPATMHPHEGKAKAPCPNCKGGALFSPEAGSTWPPHRERRDSTESGRRAEGTVPREPQSRCA